MAVFQFDWPGLLTTVLDAGLPTYHSSSRRGFEVWRDAEDHLRRLVKAGADSELVAFAFVRLCEATHKDSLGPRPQRARSKAEFTRRTLAEFHFLHREPSLHRRARGQHSPLGDQFSRRARGQHSPSEALSAVLGASWHCRCRTDSPQWATLADLVAAVWPPLLIATSTSPDKRWNQLRDVIQRYSKRSGDTGKQACLALTDALSLAIGQPLHSVFFRA